MKKKSLSHIEKLRMALPEIIDKNCLPSGKFNGKSLSHKSASPNCFNLSQVLLPVQKIEWANLNWALVTE